MIPLHLSHDLGRGHLGFAYRMLTLIIVWLALQLPLGALIGTFLEGGSGATTAPRGGATRRGKSVFQALAVAEPLSISVSFELTPHVGRLDVSTGRPGWRACSQHPRAKALSPRYLSNGRAADSVGRR